MKHSLGRFGLGNASFGLGLFFIIIDSYISNSILSYKISWCLCHRLTWLFENDHIPFKSEPLLFFQKLFLEPSATAQCYDLKFIYHSAKIINKHEHTIFFYVFLWLSHSAYLCAINIKTDTSWPKKPGLTSNLFCHRHADGWSRTRHCGLHRIARGLYLPSRPSCVPLVASEQVRAATWFLSLRYRAGHVWPAFIVLWYIASR